MMPLIRLDPEQLHNVSRQLSAAEDRYALLVESLSGDWARLEESGWQGRHRAGAETHWASARGGLAAQTERLGAVQRQLLASVQALETADAQGARGMDEVIERHPAPTPTPAPEPEPPLEGGVGVGDLGPGLRAIWDYVDEWSKPLDWVHDHQGASKRFHEAMKGLGRLLNKVGKRGNVKRMDELATFFEKGGNAAGVLSTFLDANDYRRYFAGELTNREIMETVAGNLVPIPVLSTKLANWMTSIMPDPDGKWKGLVPPVY
jgi:uncharacterized protein YukE